MKQLPEYIEFQHQLEVIQNKYNGIGFNTFQFLIKNLHETYKNPEAYFNYTNFLENCKVVWVPPVKYEESDYIEINLPGWENINDTGFSFPDLYLFLHHLRRHYKTSAAVQKILEKKLTKSELIDLAYYESKLCNYEYSEYLAKVCQEKISNYNEEFPVKSGSFLMRFVPRFIRSFFGEYDIVFVVFISFVGLLFGWWLVSSVTNLISRLF